MNVWMIKNNITGNFFTTRSKKNKWTIQKKGSIFSKRNDAISVMRKWELKGQAILLEFELVQLNNLSVHEINTYRATKDQK